MEGRHPPRAHRRGDGRPALRLAGLQARQEQRHRLLHRRANPRGGRRTDQPGGVGEDRRCPGRRVAARQRRGVRRLLPLPRRSGRARPGRSPRGCPARRKRARRRGHRRSGRARRGHGLHRRAPFPALTPAPMRFRCEQCSTEYSLPDEAVARATRARCPRCKHSQLLHPGGVPLTTPGGGKSEIGRLALTTRTVEPEPEPEEELFGELDWEADSQLDFVVGRSHVPFDQVPPAPPPAAPVAPPAASLPPAALRSPSSAPIDFSDIHIEDAAEDPGHLRGGPEADAWPETERSDPWSAAPLPPVQRTPAPNRPPPAASPTPVPPAARPPAAPPAQKTPPRAGPPAIPTGSPPPAPRSGSPTPVPRAAATPAEPCAACGGKLVDADDLASGVCGACRARTAAALGRGRPGSVSGGSSTPALSRGAEPDTADLSSPLLTPPTRPRYAFRTMPPPDRRGLLWVLLLVLLAAAAVSGVLWYLRVRPDPADLKAGADVLPHPGKKKA